MGSPHATEKMISDILNDGIRDRGSNGCKEPIALVKSNVDTDNNVWYFTDRNVDVVNSAEVVFGVAPEDMIAALEVYLGFDEPKLKFIENHSWGGSYSHVSIKKYPEFNIENPFDVETLVSLINKYGEIALRFNQYYNEKEYIEIRRLLALKGYTTTNNSNIVRKDSVLAKSFLTRLKKRKTAKSHPIFLVTDLQTSARSMMTYLPQFGAFKFRNEICDTFTNLISYLFIFEGIYGVDSRYRLEPFRQMIGKWRLSTKRSPAFKKESVAKFVAWLDREAALPAPIDPPTIQVADINDIVDKLAKTNTK